MRKICKVSVNGEEFSANCGDLLLDAALMNGVDIPHDCRSGYCGTCRVNVVSGRTFGADGTSSDVVQACQARVISDLKVEIEDVPETQTDSGRIVELSRLAPDVVEAAIAMPRPIEYLPGQHYKVQFRGFPARCYSPTFPLFGPFDPTILRFHVRLVPNGRVSSALGRDIRVGHRVKLVGPLGAAFLRPGHRGRIVLVASGTGFAPMWSVAVAAIGERRDREMAFVVSARTLGSLYMLRALCQLAHYPGVTIIPVVSEPQTMSPAIRTGRPTSFMPRLSPSDVVYAAGAPAMVDSVARMAKGAGARCYMDPFIVQGGEAEQRSLQARVARVAAWFSSDVLSPPSRAPTQAPASAREPARARASARALAPPPSAGDITRSMQDCYDRGAV